MTSTTAMESDAPPSASPASSTLTGVSSTATRVELVRIIWALAWPSILTFALESLVGLVDLLMVGRLGADAVAGVGVGTQILHAIDVIMIAVSTGTVALVARHIGAGEPREAERVVLQSLYVVGLIATVTAAVVFWYAPGILRLFGVEPAVLRAGTAFTRTIVFAVPSAAVFVVIASALRGAGDTRTPLVVGALVNAINIAGNYVLIFGKLGLPALGVVGSALASVIAFTVGATAFLVLVLRGGSVLTLRHLGWAPSVAVARRVFRIGAPTAAEQLFMQVGFMLYLAVAATYGTAAVAAYFIGVRILSLSFLPGFGFGAAASTLVGQNLGAQNANGAERSGWEANRLAMLFMSTGGIVVFVLARDIAQVFIDDPAVVSAAVLFIHALAAAQPLMAADFTLGGALRGAGDTRFPLLTVLVGFYGARLGFAYLAAFVLSLGLGWVWLALVGDYAARAALKAWRFRSGRWKTVRV